MNERNVEIAGRQAKTLHEFVRTHNLTNDGQRLGQRFVNIFIKQPFPELFYETSDRKSLEVISNWLTQHHYFNRLPQPV